jgi:hypothetical protein
MHFALHNDSSWQSKYKQTMIVVMWNIEDLYGCGGVYKTRK